MTSQRPHLITSESPVKQPILIIDKNGIISEELVDKLKDQFLIVLLTTRELKTHENLTSIYYGKKIPVIPDENYAAIIVIYHGEKSTLDLLPPVAKKVSEIKSNLVFITSLYYYDKKLKKILNNELYDKVTKIIYGDVFGKEELDQNFLTGSISQVRLYNKIDIPESGLQKIYPVTFNDLCDAIVAIIFMRPLKAGTNLVMSRHGFTHLSIARSFQKHDPGILINFKPQKNKDIEYEFPHDAQYFFPDYNIGEKLKTIDLTKKHIPPVRSEAAKINKKPPRHPRVRPSNKLLLIILFLLFFIMPVLAELILLLGGSFFLSESINKIQENNLSSARSYNLMAKTTFFASGIIGENLSFLSPFLFSQKEPISQKAEVGKSLTDIEGNFLDSIVLMKGIYDGKSSDPKKDFLHVTSKIKNSLVTLQELKAEGNLPQLVLDKIKPFDESLALVGNTIDTYPDLLGFNQKKKYLILFQNNMELRPGGGFIGSFATVEIKNGKTGKLEIHDVYDADGKLSTHVEPPFALRRYLGVTHLFLRDSNFDVDFVANAATAQTFLQLETGEKADVVIAVDTDFVKSLISILGPLDLPDFKETVTADNFYLLTQTHAEKDFFPGSTQKQDFLRGVYNALEAKLTESKKIPFSLLARKISEAFQKKQLLIAIPATESQKIFTVNKLSNSLQDDRVGEGNELLDFLGINEANLGMNKSNYYLKRSIDQKVNIDGQGNVTEKLTLTYENTSSQDSAFGGDYKNYLRFILPANAFLQSVEVNGTRIPTTPAITQAAEYTKIGFVPPSQLEVEKTLENGKLIYGFFMILPMHSSQKISISYSLGSAYNLSQSAFTYDLYRLKQPGTGDDPYSFSISYPAAFHAIQGAGSFTDVGGKLLYSDTLSADKDFVLRFSKK